MCLSTIVLNSKLYSGIYVLALLSYSEIYNHTKKNVVSIFIANIQVILNIYTIFEYLVLVAFVGNLSKIIIF